MIPGLFRTLIGLVVAWFVFRFLDRMFGGGGRAANRQTGRHNGASRPRPDTPRSESAKDDHLGEYIDFEEVDGEERGE